MDRASLSAAMIQELADIFAAEVARAAPWMMGADLDGIERQVQALGRRVVGRVVEQVVAVRAAAEPSTPPACAGCRQPMRLVEVARPRQLRGLVGEYSVGRAYFVCDVCHQGTAPLDERLGIGAGTLSPGLARVACRVGIEDSFGAGTSVLDETLGVDVPPEAIRRITEGIGAVAEAEQQAAVARVQRGQEPVAADAARAEGAVLLVEADGVYVHSDGDWHEMKVGLVAPLGPATRLDEESQRTTLRPGAPGYATGLEEAELFWYRLHAEACRRGLGTLAVSLVVVPGDGADWIWRYAARFLGVGRVQLVEIVDIDHAWDHLWTVGHAVFGAGTAAAAAWVVPLKKKLLAEGPGPVLAALGEPPPGEEAAAETVRQAIGYFTTHAARMDYPAFVARQLPIGSGAVESAGKTLIQEREKGAGMRWGRAGAQHVATPRALHRSGRWEAFWRTHPQRRRPAVVPRRTATPTTAEQPVEQAA